MTGFLGVPTSPLTKPEKPDFFLRTPGIFASLASSEYRFSAGGGCDVAGVMGCIFSWWSAAEKLADWRSGGGAIGRGSGPAREEAAAAEGGGAGRARGGGDLMASMRLR